MKNFDYHNPTRLVFGKDTIKDIGKFVSEYGDKKVLLLYGKGSIFKNGVYDEVVQSLDKYGIDYVEMSGVQPNPVLSKVRETVDFMKKENVDAIVAVGGGSVLDTSKIAAASFYYDGDPWDFYEKKVFPEKALPIYGVLTISATGSEMNSGGVITNEEEKKKWGWGSKYTYPRLSIVDPSIQKTLPVNQTVNGAVDTLTHVFEEYFDGTKDTLMADEFAEGIIRTTMETVKVLIKDPNDYEARANLAWAATLALNGLNGLGRRGDWASHGIEHSISAYYDIAHAEGLAMVMPAWMKFVYKEDVDKFARFGEKIFGITGEDKEEVALKAIEAYKSFLKEIGAPVALSERNIGEDKIDVMAKNALLRGPLGGLKKLEEEDVYKILMLAR
ncbi:iron-containing alcohol dehydrogenase [Proteiniclasticum sp.]|uniref:iron-containing alcohol dehydrogenase n=1 Tax=Proteiniclasticum sp. TaxID=2053595 RepID=UPI00289D4BFC|nr:iron-containing alcohol dehydrogenase [Proteiniclasticum sp.]